MQNHFNKLTTPLLSLPHYPTLRTQARRFLDAGYSEIEACDLNTFFYGVMSNESRSAALNLELFDEYEELSAFLGHYFILVARNQEGKHYLRPQTHHWQYICWKKDTLLNGNITPSDHCHESKSVEDQLLLQSLSEIKSVQRRFLAISTIDDGVLIHGGLSTTTRLATSLQLRPVSGLDVFESSSIRPSSRMCHTLTSLGNGRVLLVGGRDAPNTAMNDVWIFDKQWRQVETLPTGIYRHSAVQIGVDIVVIFGGRTNSGVSKDWFLYTYQQGWQKLTCEDDCPALCGASLGWNNNQGILVGGINQDGKCEGNIYTWYIEQKFLSITLQKWQLPAQSQLLTRRYGAKIVPWGEAEFLLIGGAGSHRILSWSEQFLVIVPSAEVIQVMDVRHTAAVEPWLIGHDVTVQNKTGDIIIVGGGGVCFSFGSFWNEKLYQFSQPECQNLIQNWKLLEETSITPPSNSPTQNLSQEIRRVKITTPEQWHQILQSSEVCILNNLNFGHCIPNWTPEYLKSKVGPEKQVIIHSTSSEAMNFLSKNFKYTTQSFHDFIDCVFSPAGEEKVYLRAVSEDAKNKPTRLEDDFPSLAEDFKIPEILCGEGGIEEGRVFSSVLRVGGVGTSMWLHYDVLLSLVTAKLRSWQISSRK